MGSIMNYNQDTIDIFTNLKVITEKHPGRLLDVLNCFNKNQYKCKKWLVDCLNNYEYHFKNKTKDSIDIAVLGGWYGLTAKLLKNYFAVKQIRNIYSYEFVEMDIKDLEIAEKSFSIIINTSCEHMEQEIINQTIAKAPKETLFVLQSNNYIEIDEHINCSASLQDFADKFKDNLKNVKMYELDMEKYTRFMLIGAKQ